MNFVAQTSLFYGGRLSDKKTAALKAAGQFLGVTPVSPETSHPDFFYIRPTRPKSQTEKIQISDEIQSNWVIKIEQIQELKSRLKYFPLEAACQLVFIDDAEMMTASAANSLLKVLEEPRPNQVFILTSNSLHKILPTIRSRCAKYYFPSVQKNEVLDFDWQELQKARQDFASLSGFIKNLVASEVDLHAFLEALRQRHLQQGGDLEFFDKITQAEFQLARHLQKEFVLENLFL